jgi:hypothetical protein
MATMTPTVTIPAGESLSNAIDCTGTTPTLIFMPSEWTGANLSFQISPDNVMFSDLFDNGREVTIPVVVGTSVRIPTTAAQFAAWIRFRSGSRNYPIAQELDRIFSVVVDLPIATGSVLPVISSLNPATAVRSTNMTLVVTGQNFTTHAIIQFAGSNRSTTFVDDAQLTATFNSGNAGTRDVLVRDAAGDSNIVQFIVT